MKAILISGFLILAAALVHGLTTDPAGDSRFEPTKSHAGATASLGSEQLARNSVCNPRVEVCEE